MAIENRRMVHVVVIRQLDFEHASYDRIDRAFSNYFDAQNYAQSNGGYVVSLGVT